MWVSVPPVRTPEMRRQPIKPQTSWLGGWWMVSVSTYHRRIQAVVCMSCGEADLYPRAVACPQDPSRGKKEQDQVSLHAQSARRAMAALVASPAAGCPQKTGQDPFATGPISARVGSTPGTSSAESEATPAYGRVFGGRRNDAPSQSSNANLRRRNRTGSPLGSSTGITIPRDGAGGACAQPIRRPPRRSRK